MYLAWKFFIGDTNFLHLLLDSETGPPFYRVIRAIWRFSHLQGYFFNKHLLIEPSLFSCFKTLSISLTLGIEPDLLLCCNNRAIPATVILIPVINSWQLAILLF